MRERERQREREGERERERERQRAYLATEHAQSFRQALLEIVKPESKDLGVDRT